MNNILLMKRWINKQKLIILMCLFLSVCSNKIRKRVDEDRYEGLNLDQIREANFELKKLQDVIHEKKHWLLEYFFPTPQILFDDAKFVLELLKNSDYIFANDLQISYTYHSKKKTVESFKYKCLSSSIYIPKKGDINYIKEKGFNTDIQRGIAQYIVLRECFEKEFGCKNFDSFCVIKSIASLLGHEMIIFEPGNHGFTKETTIDDEGDFLFNGEIIFNKTVKFALLYSSNKYFTFKTKWRQFHFDLVFNNDNSAPPYLILLDSDIDKNQIQRIAFNEADKECSLCLEELNKKETFITKCGHKYHKECLRMVTDEKCH